MPPVPVTRADVEAAQKWLAENCSVHPVHPLPDAARIAAALQQGEEGIAAAQAAIDRREERIRLEDVDAFHHGYELEWWADADQLMANSVLTGLFGGNGSAKTFFACKRGVQLLSQNDRPRKVLFLHESETVSVDVHQSAVYHFLPPGYKGIKRSRRQRGSVLYDERTGFTDNRFVLPNGSIGQFGFYSQDIKRYEGTAWDLIVADEDFPLGWLKTLIFRLWRRKGVTGKVGQILWCFTPVKGMTPAIREVITGARLLETRPVDPRLLSPQEIHVKGCPAGHMPYRMKSAYYNAGLMFAFTQDSPWSGYEDAVESIVSMRGSSQEMPTDQIKTRFYGWARNVVKTQFPKFSPDVHVIPEHKVPSAVTRYMKVDPHGKRNFFIAWCAVDAHGRHYFEREWPDYDDWAVTSEHPNRYDGDPGPAQQKLGHGIVEYKRLILEAEGARWDASAKRWDYTDHRSPHLRFIDPRSGAEDAKAMRAGSASLIDRFYEEQTDKDGNVTGPSMDFRPASGQHEDEGLQAITNLLDYDDMAPLTPLINEPRAYVTENCANIIWALTHYTGQDGQKAACKDPLDCVRGLATADLDHVPEDGPRCTNAMTI